MIVGGYQQVIKCEIFVTKVKHLELEACSERINRIKGNVVEIGF